MPYHTNRRHVFGYSRSTPELPLLFQGFGVLAKLNANIPGNISLSLDLI